MRSVIEIGLDWFNGLNVTLLQWSSLDQTKYVATWLDSSSLGVFGIAGQLVLLVHIIENIEIREFGEQLLNFKPKSSTIHGKQAECYFPKPNHKCFSRPKPFPIQNPLARMILLIFASVRGDKQCEGTNQ